MKCFSPSPRFYYFLSSSSLSSIGFPPISTTTVILSLLTAIYWPDILPKEGKSVPTILLTFFCFKYEYNSLAVCERLVNQGVAVLAQADFVLLFVNTRFVDLRFIRHCLQTDIVITSLSFLCDVQAAKIKTGISAAIHYELYENDTISSWKKERDIRKLFY